jgi:hypothetical protein
MMYMHDGADTSCTREDDSPWQTKEELEALEAELNPESLVLTECKEQREPPPVLVLSLLPYQKEFLAWGLKQELGQIRGGILAGMRCLSANGNSHAMKFDSSVHTR